jgi:CxxC motif-containing protein (DUF1111 family)
MILLSPGCTTPQLNTPPVFADVGEPLPFLTDDELVRFEAGKALFVRPFAPSEGLGPRFNENACSACHTFPADGGTGETSVTKATRFSDDGRCDLLVPQGGENIRIQVTPLTRSLGGFPERSVAGATHTARFTIPFVFGLGLVDAIPVETLEARADPDDRDGDGISGRLGTDGSGQPARFGRKADVATLADFAAGAFGLEMGLTTPVHPDESRTGSLPAVPEGSDPAADPEVDAETLGRVVDFMRFLAPPAPAELDGDPQVAQGREQFESLGCVRCHVPEMRAGHHASTALSDQSIALFSDLLLHDMGAALTGTCAPGASPTEYRTEPLMGLRYRQLYLHDGRTSRVMDAILLHGGEAQKARDAFAALDRLTQETLLRFLNTL